MDDDMKKSCPSCSQLYYLQLTSSHIKGNLPLFLPCGHTTCENCIVNIIKCLEPIECKVCSRDADVKITDPNEFIQDKIKFYQKFPVNYQMVGELTVNLMKAPVATSKKTEEDCFIDLNTLLKSDAAQGICLECNANTSTICKDCAINLCEACFNKTHKNFVIFKNHVLQSIESNVPPSTCKLHIEKPLDYYCNDCKKSICTDCMMLSGESCRSHDVKSFQDVIETFLGSLTDVYPQVDEIFKRLSKTAVDIGYLLHNYENDTGSSKELSKKIDSVEQHFSKLFSVIQKQKNEIIHKILDLKSSEKDSLQKVRSEVANSIKTAKNVLDMITFAIETYNIKKINLPDLLEEAKKVANTPWFLNNTGTNKESLKVTVNENLSSLITEYVQLEGNVKSEFKLFSTSELGADVEIPPAPKSVVYPPELPKELQKQQTEHIPLRRGVKQGVPIPRKLFTNALEDVFRNKDPSKNARESKVKKEKPPSLNKSGSSVASSNCSDNSSKRAQNNYMVQPVLQQGTRMTLFLPSPQQLSEGSQELIYISYIVNPNNFFVQRACFQAMFQDMVHEFQNAISFNKPALNEIRMGDTYLVFNESWHYMWQRCRVVNIDRTHKDPIIQVFCFDFGHMEFVTVDRLRLLPSTKVQSIYPFAINCSLFNCKPKMGEWTSNDTHLIQNIIENKQTVMHIHRIISSNVEFKVECDVTTFETGVSLAHALEFHDRAIMPNPSATYTAIRGVREKLKLHTSNNEYLEKKTESVSIIHIVSPDKFYVRKRHLCNVYEKLLEDLQQEYSLASHAELVYLPEKGMACVVNLANCRSMALGNKWARGVVAERPGRAHVRVSLPDLGQQELVHWTALRYIHPKFTRITALATECHLAGITPCNNKWNSASVELLRKYESYVLELRLEDKRNRSHRSQGSIGVTLCYKPLDDKVVNINNEMIQHKFAIPFGVTIFNNTSVEGQALTNKSSSAKPKPSAPSNSKRTIVKRKINEEMPEKLNDNDLQAKDKGPLRLEVKVLNCESPSLIYVSFIHQQQTYKDFFDKIQKTYSKKNKNAIENNWQIGDRCVTLCKQSQTWRRAVITELENDNAKLFYSDFACIETIPKSALKELTPELARFGDAAVKCHLCGIMPAMGEVWPSITKECLKEFIDEYKRFFITKLGNFKDKSMPIQLWVYHTEAGGALEPNVSTWRCLNDKIVERGLCVPDRTQVVTTEDNTEDAGLSLSFLNITGSVNDWLQLDPMPMRPLSISQADEDMNVNSPSSILENEDIKPLPREGRETSGPYITDWLSPEPLSSTEFTARPMYIDYEAVIFLHDVRQEETLDYIRKELSDRYKDPDPRAKFNKWNVGEPCVALYDLDNSYYRGRVIEVNEEKSSCIIHYIDYGCDETCDFENLRKGFPLHELPVQAHKCSLDRIRPLGEKWVRNTLDYIHKVIVEKRCYVKVTGEPVNGVVPVDLKCDKMWINDHLVEVSLAEYTEGSKRYGTSYASIDITNKEEEEIEDDIIVSDSGPDYIVVDDEDTDSISQKSADWETLKEQDQLPLDGQYISYARNAADEFCCNITTINDIHTLELTLIFDDDTTNVYNLMDEELQSDGMNMPPLNGLFENKACVAIFPEDNRWYRATISQFCEKTNQVKVKYVDYGNVSVIPLADIREISEELATLVPATITAKLFGVELNPDVDIKSVRKEYTELFLNRGPFNVKVISNDSPVPLVEIRNKENELVYNKLIENNMFIQCHENSSK